MDRIIPADEFPSASAAGVLNYIQRIFDTDLRAAQDSFISGLGMLYREAEARHSAPFARIAPTQQDTLISELAKNDTTCVWSAPAADFIRAAINLVSEGYYADPGNGGNLDEISWRMIGFKIAEGIRLPVECAQ